MPTPSATVAPHGSYQAHDHPHARLPPLQMAQHGDPPAKLTQRAYTNFLVDSPLRHVARAEDASAPACGYGSFHQQYRLDGRLVAVGVVDVLPR